MKGNNLKLLETEFHVRYAETDAMGVVHNATYLIYFEEGRSVKFSYEVSNPNTGEKLVSGFTKQVCTDA